MIRVLHVLGALNPGGVETWLMNVLRHIDRNKFQLDFCTFGPEKGVFAAEAEWLGSTVHSCPIQAGTLSLGRRFRKIVREGRYNVVHSHVFGFSGAVLRWAHKENVPMRMSHSHNTEDGKQSTLLRRAYRVVMRALLDRHATHCLAVSKAAAAMLYGSDWESNPRVRLIYCGIDTTAFEVTVNPGEVRRELGLPLGVPVVGHVGRFDGLKNHKFLIEIAREVIARRPDCHFLLVGDGPLRPVVEAQTKSSGLCKNVHFMGVRHDVPRLLLGAMDAFVFPSTYEGMPLALIEAQAAGLPILVSNSVTREAIVCETMVTALSLESGPSKWAQSLLRLLSSSGDSAVSCLDSVRSSRYSIDSSLSALQNLYLNGMRT